MFLTRSRQTEDGRVKSIDEYYLSPAAGPSASLALPSLLVVSSMHINKPFPRLTHSSLSQHARASFVTTGGRRGCLQRLCFVRVRHRSATRRRGCVEPRQRTGRVPTSTPRPAARQTGRRDGESERERGEGSRARMVWFIVWRTADPPSERAT